jgi:hypothetical protein
VLEAAEAFVEKLVGKLGEKNKSMDEIKFAVLERHADPLNDFAPKCRLELREVYAQSNWRRKYCVRYNSSWARLFSGGGYFDSRKEAGMARAMAR